MGIGKGIIMHKEIANDVLNDRTLFLKERLGLTLNSNTRIFKNKQGVNFVGYKINEYRLKIRHSSKVRMKRKLKHYTKLKKREKLNYLIYKEV